MVRLPTYVEWLQIKTINTSDEAKHVGTNKI